MDRLSGGTRIACLAIGLAARWAAAEPAPEPVQASAVPKVINYRNDGSGVYPDARPPIDLDWSAPSSVLWKTAIPGSACASDPIIVGERMFVQSEPLRLICLDKHTGKVLWERENHARADVPEEDKAFRLERYYLWWRKVLEPDLGKPGVYGGDSGPRRFLASGKVSGEVCARLQKAMQAEPETWSGCNTEDTFGHSCCVSPVSDGHRVAAAFRNGEVVCYDLDGKRQWIYLILNKDGTVPAGRVKGHTPLMADGKVVIYWTAPARFLCLDALKGRELWSTDLEKIEGRGFSRSPAVVRRGGAWYACSPGGTMVNVGDGGIVSVADTFAPAAGRARSYFMPVSVCPDAGIFDCGYLGVASPAAEGEAGRVAWRFPIHWLQQNLAGGAEPLSAEAVTALVRDRNTGGLGWGGERYFAGGVTRDGIVYSYSSSHMAFAARDVKTGKLFYMKNLTDKPNPNVCQYADLCLAGDCIFVNNGAFVLKAGRELSLVKRMRAGGHYACNLVFDVKRVYWRDARNVICVGNESPSRTVAGENRP
jgi:outer membrane protein assembly factor BamB